jgi:hypothetical protein
MRLSAIRQLNFYDLAAIVLLLRLVAWTSVTFCKTKLRSKNSRRDFQ